MNPRIAPYGSWTSPITAEAFTARSVSLSQLRVDGADIYWVEGHPQRDGRSVLLKRDAFGQTREILPLLEGSRLVHVATRVHDYGGRAYAVKNGLLIVSDGLDDRVYRFDSNDPRAQLVPLTQLANCRYGDFEIDEVRGIAYAVREDHRGEGEPTNALVAIPLDGSGARDESLIFSVFEGTDFVSSPTLSPDGTKLAWLTWNHPEMPWTKSELRVGALDFDGKLESSVTLVDRKQVCVYEPRWTLDGDLIHVDDSTGWANLYRTEGFTWRTGEPEDAWTTRLRTRALHPSSQAFSQPHWRLGLHSYDNLDHDHLICSWSEKSAWHIGTIRLDNGLLEEWETGWMPAGNVAADDGRVVFLGDSEAESPAIITVEGTSIQAIRPTSDAEVAADFISLAQYLSWPTRDGAVCHGFYYPPCNPDFEGEEGTLPPLIVKVHPGPTAAANPGLQLDCQYWTSRGFAVLDVNYRGSTGYGRKYREAINGNLGIHDVNDSADGVAFLADKGLIDVDRVAIRGASTGGYTALAALASTDVFSAGTSLYGISDLRTMTTEAHKFESRYVHLLLQSDDLTEPIWSERSPIENLAKIDAPLLFLQGTADKVVPLSQTQRAYEQMVANGKEVALVVFEDEGHGFIRPDSIELAWRSELSFYGEVWGIEVDQALDVPIANAQ